MRPADRRVRAAATTVVVAACAALVAVAADGRHGGARIDAATARTPLIAALVIVLAAAGLAWAGLLVVMWPERGGGQSPRRTRALALRSRLAMFALACSLLVGMIIALLLSLHGGRAPRIKVIGVPHLRIGTTFTLPAWVPWLIGGVIVAGAGLGVASLVRRRRARRHRVAEPISSRSAAAGEAVAALDAVSDPRAAVIAAYLAMEQGLTERGLGRRSSEAPREYLRRVLSAGGGAPGAAETLTGLFEEARFSAHPISEALRDRARAALLAWREPAG